MVASVRDGEAVGFHILSFGPEAQKALTPTKPPADKIFVCNSYPMILGNNPLLILGRNPKLCYARVMLNGSGVVAFGTSMSDCQDAITVGAGEQIGGVAYVNSAEFNADLQLEGTTELWAVLVAANEPGLANPVPSQPAVPASTVSQQNVNPYPVYVVISGGSGLTAVTVNGLTVGTGDGTYIVPAAGTISVTYSVTAPTWVWSNANPALNVVPTVISVIREINR